MTATLPRGNVTAYLLIVLNAGLDFPVGDNEPPAAAHGWQGQPNTEGANFIPWVTLNPGTASYSSGTLTDAQADWRANYYLTTAAITREQTEGLADLARDLLVNTSRSQLVTPRQGRWAILQVKVPSIGAITRVGTTSPAHFVQTDAFEIWLSKELT